MKQTQLTHLFFDLDHTLWDTDFNATKSMEEMFLMYSLEEKGIADKKLFLETYRKINHTMWNDYSRNKIDKEYLRKGRFELTLEKFGIKNEELVTLMSEYFVDKTPSQTRLIEDAGELLEYLSEKYQLYIITNGFKEAQHRKLKAGAIHHYFKDIFISEEVGYNKPDPKLFDLILDKLKVKKENCLMIGDNPETDIEGAVAAGWCSVYFNPAGDMQTHRATYEIKRLIEMKDFL